MTSKQRADLTFKDNIKRGRHGWVRLTPAYSVKIVQDILDNHPNTHHMLEPFSGTGTTGLVAGQQGRQCDLFDINPFLIWLANVKCANYSSEQLRSTQKLGNDIVDLARTLRGEKLWTPPISNIDRWWSQHRLITLAKLYNSIQTICPKSSSAKNLILVAFCRVIIQWSNAAFNHQSMSFKEQDSQLRLFNEEAEIFQTFLNDLHAIITAARINITGKVQAQIQDARQIDITGKYDAVITSPPYVNRMSYIRELRPYMYWLGYLVEARDAGNLDWEAIGGTWGIATSRLNDWTPHDTHVDLSNLDKTIDEIAQSSPVLSKYVHKYFVDMATHFKCIYDAVAKGGKIFYVIGNSKFYDTLVPAEKIYAELMHQSGFQQIDIQVIRKRNSKKELFEYLVTAQKS